MMKQNLKLRMSKLLASSLVLSLLFTGCAATAPATPPSGTTDNTGGTGGNADGGTQTVKVVMAGPAMEEAYYVEQLAQFEDDNPDIQVNLIFTPNDSESYGQAVQLMFADNDAPDIFRVSASFSTNMVASYAKGWLAPIDQYLTDDFKNSFPEGSFASNGGLMIDGEIYGLPFIAAEFPAFRPMIYNMDVLREYGIEEVPTNWTELEAMLNTVTQESGGSVYGLGIGGNDGGQYAFVSMGETIRTDSYDTHVTEGTVILDPNTGMANGANEGLIASAEFIKSLNQQGLMIPGWETADGATMCQYLATGRVAAVVGNSYWSSDIMAMNPELEIAITRPIAQSDEDVGRRYIYAPADPYYAMSSTAQYPEATWKVLEFISSVEFQAGFYEVTGRATVGYRSYDDGVLTDFMQVLMDAASEYLRVAPNPVNQHEDASVLFSAITGNVPKPHINELFMMSIVNNQSFEEMAKEYDAKLDVVIDEQIKILQDAGSDITRDVFIFPSNWDMDQNYIQ